MTFRAFINQRERNTQIEKYQVFFKDPQKTITFTYEKAIDDLELLTMFFSERYCKLIKCVNTSASGCNEALKEMSLFCFLQYRVGLSLASKSPIVLFQIYSPNTTHGQAMDVIKS